MHQPEFLRRIISVQNRILEKGAPAGRIDLFATTKQTT
jgi:hypothetical protein